MPTVYLPLASAEAYGAIGEMIVFQGQTCRAYVVPYDPRTDAQLNVRELFYDVTKMEHFCGAWFKGACKVVFGSRWYTMLYKRVAENDRARYTAAALVWDGFTTLQKEAWNTAAPFQVTYNAPGEVFYVLMGVMWDWMQELGAPGYEFPGIDADSAVDVGAWAVRTLADVLTSGAYEDSNAHLTYAGSWSTISDVNASGGAYRVSASTGGPSVSFYFYGTQFSIVHEKDSTRGQMQIETFGMATQTINQNDSVQTWLNEWVSVGLIKGLHYVTITRTGTGAINLDALTISARLIKTPSQAAIADTFVIPAVSLTRTSDQSIPGYVTGYPFYLLEWNAENFDNVGMHDLVVDPGRVVCKVPGYYGVRCFVQIYAANPTFIWRLELRLNGVTVALNEYNISTPIQKAVWGEVARFVEMVEGDYLEVWIRHDNTGARPVQVAGVYAPVFEIQMFQRTTLQVGTVNVTEQVGVTDHGAMTGLGDDDHVQYYNQTRGDARYSLLSASDPYTQYYNQTRGDARYSQLGHVHGAPVAETNSNDIFRCDSPGGVSAFVGTIATLPGGAVLTYNVTSGNEGVMVPASTSHLAKVNVYNTTRGTSALISNSNAGSNTLTLTANVPGGWLVGDTITVASQTVSGGGFSWIDLALTSGPLGYAGLFINLYVLSATAGHEVLTHPFETYAASKLNSWDVQVANGLMGGLVFQKIVSNKFAIAWTGAVTRVVVREAGYPL